MTIEILLDSHHGRYIPQLFIESYSDMLQGMSDEDIQTLHDPDNEWYWDAWDMLLNTCTIVDKNGREWCLHHDGDLFAYHSLTAAEELHLFGQ